MPEQQTCFARQLHHLIEQRAVGPWHDVNRIRRQLIAMAALVISSSSLVMLAWRSLLYSRVKSLISCLALSVAFFMATMRALCSEALASSKIWKTWKFR